MPGWEKYAVTVSIVLAIEVILRLPPVSTVPGLVVLWLFFFFEWPPDIRNTMDASLLLLSNIYVGE